MGLEMFIIIISIIITALLLIMFVPRNKILDAHISFLFMQVQTWLFGALVVEARLINYPVRLLDYAYRVSLSFEYFIFPSISALFNIYFPAHRSLRYKIFYTALFPSVMTIIEVILEKNTRVINYIHWTWYYSWISIYITLLITYWYYLWFMKKMKEYTK